MAVDSEGRESKASSQFLSEHEDSFAKQNPFERESWPSYFRSSDSFLSFGSAFSSPVESEIGSTEIESDKDDDDDDYTAELSRRMAQYMLQDDDNQATPRFGSEKLNKSWGLSGSPISTLWSPLGSSQGSPEGPSKEPSPPTTPVVAEDRGSDVSYNVFSKFEKMNVCSDGPKNTTTAETPKSIQTGLENGLAGFFPHQDSSDEQVRALKNHKRKQQQFMKQRGSPMQAKQAQGFSSNACPTLRQQANSGMKAVFPSGSGSKSGSPGTGVFLPRHTNKNRPSPSPSPTPTQQPQKKKGCSTVLIPVKVLQALQLHYERLDTESRQKITGFSLRQEAMMGARNGTHAGKKSQLIEAAAAEEAEAEAEATSQTDTGLPQEWTY